MNEAELDAIVQRIGATFRTFGGERASSNPIADAMTGKPLVFALGVPVRDVVVAVLLEAANDVLRQFAEKAQR